MSDEFHAEYRGISIEAISYEVDRLFGFSSQWIFDTDSKNQCCEFQGKITISVHAIDSLCSELEVGPGDVSHVLRYAMSHLKTHHFQELNPTYSKSYEEDLRPYEIEADMAAGWICANANLANSFRVLDLAKKFNDFGRLDLITQGASSSDASQIVYPWPAEREMALLKGARLWAAGRIALTNPPGVRIGLSDQSFEEFLAEVPIFVNSLWRRPVPKDALSEAGRNNTVQLPAGAYAA